MKAAILPSVAVLLVLGKTGIILLAHIRTQFKTSNETYSSPRMCVELNEDGHNVGRHRVVRLMRDNNLKALQNGVIKRRQTAITVVW